MWSRWFTEVAVSSFTRVPSTTADKGLEEEHASTAPYSTSESKESDSFE